MEKAAEYVTAAASPKGITFEDYRQALQEYARCRFDITECNLDVLDGSKDHMGDHGIVPALSLYPWLLAVLPQPHEHFAASIVTGEKSITVIMHV